MKRFATLLVIPVLTVFAVACSGGDDEGDDAPTNVPSIVAPTEAGETPTAEATATEAAGETATPGATASPEGTPFSGSTDPVSFDAEGQPDDDGLFELDDVRVGRHDDAGGFDRIVFEFDDDGRPGGLVEYVDEATQCGSGEPVQIEGEALLSVRFDMTRAHDDDGDLTIDDVRVDGPGNSILEAVSYCDFEGVVQWAIGVPEELPINVTFLNEDDDDDDDLDDPRVVIDIQHP